LADAIEGKIPVACHHHQFIIIIIIIIIIITGIFKVA